MFTPSAPAPGRDERWVRRHLADLPDSIRGDVGSWVDALGGQGRRPSPPLAWVSVRNYLMFAEPALLAWVERYGSLRAVTRADIEEAVRDHPGRSRPHTASALRSVFRGLKRERRVFADPVQGVSVCHVPRLPRPLPADRLRGLLDKVTHPRHRLVTALVAVHAVSLEELQALRLTDYDSVRCTLSVDRAGLPFTLVLEEVVAQMVVEWVRARAATWPRTRNPHLLITRTTAFGQDPISRYGLGAPFRELGITARQLRADRILDEAHHSADPAQLMRVFGIGVTSAVRYARIAHPDRYTPEPAMP